MLIFIIGYMCSGKTTLGKNLALKLNHRFIDFDEIITKTTGLTIVEFFEKYGEETFRIKERELLIQHLEDQDTIIATGGGTPCFLDNMDLMNRSGLTLFLDTPADVILQRVSGKTNDRPLLKAIPADQLFAFISIQLGSRRGFYEKAKIRVEDGNAIEFILAVILSTANHTNYE